MSQSGKIVRIVSGGDVEFEDPMSRLPSVATPEVQAALGYLKKADICFLNCEMGISQSGYKVQKMFNIRTDPANIKDLVALGPHVVTLANNHVMDFGYDGLFETLENIDSAGIARVGAGRDLDEALRPHFRTVDGVRFAFMGLSCTLPPGSAAGVNRPGLGPIRVATSYEIDPGRLAEGPGAVPTVHSQAFQEDVDRVCDVIAAAKKESDFVLVGIHWGVVKWRANPSQGQVAEYQPPLGKAMLDAGAEMILGHHTHNLLGVEVYKGKPIFYSLGNLIFQPLMEFMEPESVIVLADFAGSSLRVGLVPVLSNPDGFPMIPTAEGRQQVIQRLQKESAQYGTRFVVDDEAVEIQL